jgi:hypothetical protein
MEKVNEYLPSIVEFVLDQGLSESIPGTLGDFKTIKEAQQFFNENHFIVMNPLIEVTRLMDAVEINDLRSEYISELEDSLPELKRNASKAAQELEAAKRVFKEQNERVSAAETKVQMLIDEINAGTKEMSPEQSKTFEIAHKNTYLYYTLVNGQLQLCKVKDIPELERSEIFNSTEANFDALKKLSIQKSS